MIMAEEGPTDRRDLGISVHQTLYQGGRVSAGVGAAESAFAADAAALDAARSDLILAVRQAWYQALKPPPRDLLLTGTGVKPSQPGVCRGPTPGRPLELGPTSSGARVDVSAADLDLTTAGNAVEKARAISEHPDGTVPRPAPRTRSRLGMRSHCPPSPPGRSCGIRPLKLGKSCGWHRPGPLARKRRYGLARGGFLPTLNADGGLNWGVTGSQDPKRLVGRWGWRFPCPSSRASTTSAEHQVQKALFEAARFDEQTARQQVEREVWEALLAENASIRTLEKNARSLFEAAQENLYATQESYRQGLSSMIALVDARTAFTDAERDTDPSGVRPPNRLCGSGSRHR